MTPWDRALRWAMAAVLAVVAGYLLVSAFEPMRLNWGDPWSDSNALTSGAHFDQEGFFALAFTPRVDISPITADTLIYTHYPPLPDLVDGFLQRITGGEHLALFRIVALLFSALSLVFFHAFMRRLWGDVIAKVAITAMATNLLFLQYADTLHHIPLYTSMGMAALAASVRWLDEKKPWLLGAVAGATFLCFFASYDYYFFVPIMVLATIKFRKQRWFRGPGLKLLLVFGLAGLASIVVKQLLAIWAVGTHVWLQDLVFQFLERTTSTYARVYKEGLSQVVFWRLYRFFSPLFYACLLVQLVSLIDWIRGRKVEVNLQPFVLLLAGAPFVLVFSQLMVEQYHPTLAFLPFAVASLATVVVYTWQRSRVIAAALFAIYLGWQVYQIRIFHKVFLHDDDIVAVRKVLANDKHNFLLTSMLVDAPSRYYWNRYSIGINPDPIVLRDQFEIFGADSPFTLVQVKDLAKHAYDKGIYMNFGGDRRWPWVSRPDYYRNAWKRPFDDMERVLERDLAKLGHVVYESTEMKVRQITLDDVDRAQRARVPAEEVKTIDFEAPISELYKRTGFTAREAATDERPGFAWLIGRQPTRTIFTLKGFGYVPDHPMIRSSELFLRLRGPARIKAVLSTPLWIPQTITISLDHHVVAKTTLGAGLNTVSFDVPASALDANGLQILRFDYSVTSDDMKHVLFFHPAVPNVAARLHRIEIER